MANLGFLYNMGNGNNPAQARLSATIGPNATAYYQFKLWQKAFRVRYEVGAPLLGVAFSPNFGQSYYEIFTRGNYDNNIKLTHPLNSPSLRQLLTLEFNLRKTTVSVGYLGDYQQADLNLIKYHNYSHMLVIGLVKRLQIKSFTL